MKLQTRLLALSGVLTLIMGIIHEAYFFIAPEELTAGLSGDTEMTLVYMFLVTGLAVIFTGFATFRTAGKFSSPVAREILVGTTVFSLFVGVGAVIGLTGNPFAYLLMGIAVFQLVALVWSFASVPSVATAA